MMNKILLFCCIVSLCACSQNKQEKTAKPEPHKYLEIKEHTIVNLYDAFGEGNKALQKAVPIDKKSSVEIEMRPTHDII